MTFKVTTHPESRTVVLHLETSETRLTYTAFRKLINGGLLEAIMEVSNTPLEHLKAVTGQLESETQQTAQPIAGEFWMVERPSWARPACIRVESISDKWIDYTLANPGMRYSVARGDMKFLHKTDSQDWNSHLG